MPRDGLWKRNDETSRQFAARCVEFVKAHPMGQNGGAWAERVLDRYADGERVPSIALEMACEALGKDAAEVRRSRVGGAR